MFMRSDQVKVAIGVLIALLVMMVLYLLGNVGKHQARAGSSGQESAGGGENPAEELRLLRAKHNLLKRTAARHQETIEALKKEIEALRAEPAQAELEKLRKELAQALVRIQELSKQLARAKPVKKKGVKVTDRDLTPGSVKKIDYRGAELLLDGYVVSTRAKDGEFRAVIVAGIDGPRGNPVMVRVAEERVDYQIHIHVTGEIAARLRPDNLSRRVRGIIREVKIEKGGFVARSGGRYVAGFEGQGILIILVVDNITVH